MIYICLIWLLQLSKIMYAHILSMRQPRPKNNGTRRKNAAYLRRICKDSVQCLMVGEKQDILNLFEHFNFKFVKHAKKIISSNNGFIVELQYQRFGYDSYAILKSNAKNNGDNLLYEYFVGKYLNTLSPYVPTFLETYGVFTYADKAAYTKVKALLLRKETPMELPDLLVPLEETMQQACIQEKYACVLIQDLKNSVTLDFFLKKGTDADILLLLPAILYLVYLTLDMLKDVYTHYDLHAENVMLYVPFAGKSIKYTYKGFSFYSPFLVKIIDYGRCYFPGAYGLFEDFTREPACLGKPGFFFNSDPASEHGIASQSINRSHDLRLIALIVVKFSSNRFVALLKDKLVYESKGDEREKEMKYGTMPNPNGYPKIQTVTDAERVIREYLASMLPVEEISASMVIHGLQHPLQFTVY